MKWRVIINGMALASLALGLPSAAFAACARIPAANISVQVMDPGPRVVSTKSIKQINAMAGSHGLNKAGFRVLGMTQIATEMDIKVRFKGQPTGTSVCVSVTNLNVNYGLKNHFVHVPREYARGSCQFRFVMRHEMAHVDVNRRTVRKYATALKNEVRSVLRRTGAIAAPTMAQGQNAQTAVVQKVLDDINARFNAELNTLHAAIDQPNGKYAAKNQCQGW